jgi:hypothetical protein
LSAPVNIYDNKPRSRKQLAPKRNSTGSVTLLRSCRPFRCSYKGALRHHHIDQNQRGVCKPGGYKEVTHEKCVVPVLAREGPCQKQGLLGGRLAGYEYASVTRSGRCLSNTSIETGMLNSGGHGRQYESSLQGYEGSSYHNLVKDMMTCCASVPCLQLRQSLQSDGEPPRSCMHK